MPSKPLTTGLLAAAMFALGGLSAPVSASDLATLFTTPQERQLINANRYRSEAPRPQPVAVEVEETPIQMLVREEVSVDYRVSGISLSAEGAHTVWINGTAYEDGARLADGSRIRVDAGDEIRVRITAPDGRHHYATSGETLTVTYLAAVEN
jgi:hypothetical protein